MAGLEFQTKLKTKKKVIFDSNLTFDPHVHHTVQTSFFSSQKQCFFFVINFFFFFSHIIQHSIQNITKQNNRHILNISKFNQKGGREGRTTKTQKSLLHTITYIKQKTLPGINGYITPILRSLHWLPVSFCADFKILMLTYKALHGLAPLSALLINLICF